MNAKTGECVCKDGYIEARENKDNCVRCYEYRNNCFLECPKSTKPNDILYECEDIVA